MAGKKFGIGLAGSAGGKKIDDAAASDCGCCDCVCVHKYLDGVDENNTGRCLHGTPNRIRLTINSNLIFFSEILNALEILQDGSVRYETNPTTGYFLNLSVTYNPSSKVFSVYGFHFGVGPCQYRLVPEPVYESLCEGFCKTYTNFQLVSGSGCASFTGTVLVEPACVNNPCGCEGGWFYRFIRAEFFGVTQRPEIELPVSDWATLLNNRKFVLSSQSDGDVCQYNYHEKICNDCGENESPLYLRINFTQGVGFRAEISTDRGGVNNIISSGFLADPNICSLPQEHINNGHTELGGSGDAYSGSALLIGYIP